MKPRGLTVCVDYSDLAQITLPSNLRHLSECWVVTAPHDTETQELCSRLPNVHTYITDEFYRDGAFFNKGRAIESALDKMDRHGNILIWDADILFPDEMPLPELKPDILYGSRRRIVEDPLQWHPSDPWTKYGIRHDGRVIGYYQLFDCESPHLKNRRPWYDQRFTHAGGGDGYFESLTPRDHQCFLTFDVLHLGVPDANWFGRRTSRMDGSIPERSDELKRLVDEYHHFKGWCGRRPSGVPFFEIIDSPDLPNTGHVCR